MNKNSIIRKNFIFTMLFGILMGLVFPIYASIFFDFDNKLKVLIFTIGCIIAGILVGLIAFIITKKTILKVVENIGNQLENFNNGELDLSALIEIDSDDDIGFLVNGFNTFLNSINELVFATKTNSENSISISNVLSNNIDKTNVSVNSIGEVINNVNTTTEDQYSNFLKTKEGLNRLNNTVLSSISHVLELFFQMNELTKQLLNQSDTVDSISEIISGLVTTVGTENDLKKDTLLYSSRELVLTTNKALDFNEEAFSEFGGMILMIEDISNRTGTLSINASIEAARSGQDGKGFKVIAQEVRALSENSQELSGVIKEKLKVSSEQIINSKKYITDSQKAYLSIINSLDIQIGKLNKDSKIIKQYTNNVKDSYSDITEMLSIIKSGLQQLKVETSNSKSLLENLEKSTDSIRNEIGQVKNMSDDIKNLSNNTNNKVSDMSLSVKDVFTTLSKLKVKG